MRTALERDSWTLHFAAPLIKLLILHVVSRPAEKELDGQRERVGEEVVISGVSGRLPESANIAEFREHLINGRDMLTEDDRRWKPGG